MGYKNPKSLNSTTNERNNLTPLKPKNLFPFAFYPCSSHSSVVKNCFFVFALSVVLSGCATAPVMKQVSGEEAQTQDLLSQAASQFASPDPPKALTLEDQAQVEWRPDRSLRVTVHQLWAARVKPDHPLPLLASINQDSQILNIQTLKLYQQDAKGDFVPVDPQPQVTWVPPQDNLPLSLSKITSCRLPDLGAGQALEVKYSLETKTSSLLVDKDMLNNPTKPHPVAPEASFAFRWNDYTPSIRKDVTLRIPANLELFGARLRLPADFVSEEPTVPKGHEKTVRLSMGPQQPIPSESYQPALQDLVPLTAFTLNKSWEEAVAPYRIRVKRYLDGDRSKVDELIGDAGSNTAEALADRVAEIKKAIEQKVDFVDTGLPVYLNPDRPVTEIIDSAKGTAHDMTVLMAMALMSVKIQPIIYLYRQASSGELIPDLPALSQFNGVLLAVASGKDLLWIDPTEPLAAPGVLPFNALDRKALGVLTPLNWRLTPSFAAKDNRKHRDVVMELDPQGNLNCTVDILAYGSAELALRQFFRATTDDKRRDLVYRGLVKLFPTVILTDYRFGDYRDISKPLDVHYTFQIPSYAKFIKGGMLFFPVVFEDVEDFFSVLHDTRQTPVVMPQNFSSDTQTIVKLPPGYQAGDLPKDITFANAVAEFSSSSKLDFGTLSYERYLGVKERVIPLGKDYKDLLAFYQAVLTQDRKPFTAVRQK